ncbi:phosphatidate cytidylyltransferase, partial [Methylobacterium organophilum]|nr:phosphatidate cytidylyltransferase [Methylobacterium organophilum]
TGQVPDYERILRQGYSRFLAPGDVVVDVGAHTGLHLVAFADLAGTTLPSAASLPVVAGVSALASVLSQAGDLIESGLKRRYGVKDSGKIIPGHGGVMDRLDGFFAVAVLAAVYLALRGGGLIP